jgi:lipopolysaccharide export system protein LptA
MNKKITLIFQILFLIINFNIIKLSLALEKDDKQPINISSDLFDSDFKNHIAHYSGNVVATQGSRTLKGDIATIYGNKNNQVIKIIMTGKPAKYSYLPKPNDKLTHASGDKIIYEPPKNLFTMIGNAYIEQNNNTYKGHKLIYNTVNETIISPSKEFKRGKMILQPEAFKSKPETNTKTQITPKTNPKTN